MVMWVEVRLGRDAKESGFSSLCAEINGWGEGLETQTVERQQHQLLGPHAWLSQ